MQEDVYKKLEAIAFNAKKVIEANKKLVESNRQLLEENNNFKKIIEIQKNTIEKIEQQNNLINIANNVNQLSTEEKKKLKSTISHQINEINQCLKLLKSE